MILADPQTDFPAFHDDSFNQLLGRVDAYRFDARNPLEIGSNRGPGTVVGEDVQFQQGPQMFSMLKREMIQIQMRCELP